MTLESIERDGEFTPKRRTNLRHHDAESVVPDEDIYRIYENNDSTGEYTIFSMGDNGNIERQSINPEENLPLVINTLSDREGRRRRCRPPHGLDMYLKAGRYISKYDYPYNTGGWPPPVNEEYANIGKFAPSEFDKYSDFSGIEIGYPVAYWRNAIAIHQWFMNVPESENPTKYVVFVSYRDLKKLKTACEKVLSSRTQEEAMKQNLFPSPCEYGGVVFDNPQMDEWYFEDLERTVEILDHVLRNFSEADIHTKFTYRASM